MALVARGSSGTLTGVADRAGVARPLAVAGELVGRLAAGAAVLAGVRVASERDEQSSNPFRTNHRYFIFITLLAHSENDRQSSNTNPYRTIEWSIKLRF